MEWTISTYHEVDTPSCIKHQANAPHGERSQDSFHRIKNIMVCQGNEKEDDLLLTWKTGEQHGIRCNLANPLQENRCRLA
jgi:hypothetical protein